MSNQFKKQDSEGNRLPEQMGKGLNLSHPDPKIKKMLDNRLEIMINLNDKIKFQKYCKEFGGVSAVLRNYINFCITK